jgi:hypothetical protein
MSDFSTRYVKLVLAVGEHDPSYVDAYYGPPELKEEVQNEKRSLDQIAGDARDLIVSLKGAAPGGGELDRLRHRFLIRQTEALVSRVEMMLGKALTFDEESMALYDAVAPHYSEEHFEAVLRDLDRALPGEGSAPAKYEAFRAQFVIPREKLDQVFRTAIDECRARTRERLHLPPEEDFTVEYVSGRPWSAYNWYQGNFRSVIQVNTELPIFIDRAIDLAAHEGYPGHHVYNMLLEKSLARDRGWTEFTVYPLYSPMSLIAEGSANYGIDVAFPGEERVRYEAKALFPIAGLDPGKAGHYYAVHELAHKLSYAGNEAARLYLNGEIDAAQAAEWLTRYALFEPARAAQRVRFFDTYRSYVINYNLGRDLVGRYVESRGGTADQADRRWKIFEDLLSSPRLASDLKRDG